MKPDTLGAEHPLQFAVVDGVYPGRAIEHQPVVNGTLGSTDEQILRWLTEGAEAGPFAALGEAAITRLLMPNTTQTLMAIIRFERCPACKEWSPCAYRRQRGY